jgi:hypothetical protein
MDRIIVKRSTPDERGVDSGVPEATPTDRLMRVWPLNAVASAWTHSIDAGVRSLAFLK